MVEAAAFQFNGFVVDLKTSDSVSSDYPDSEENVRFINGLHCLFFKMGAESPEIPDPGPDPVQIRMIRVPKHRIPEIQGDSGDFTASRSDMNDLFRCCGCFTRIFPDQRHFCFCQTVFCCLIADLYFDFQEVIPVRDLFGMGEDPLRRDMNFWAMEQMNAAV